MEGAPAQRFGRAVSVWGSEEYSESEELDMLCPFYRRWWGAGDVEMDLAELNFGTD